MGWAAATAATAALRPLLQRLVLGRPRTALAVPVLAAFGEDHLAEKFREHLTAAGLDRAELHATTQTHVRANFRSCRDSGITWLAMSGLGVDKICRRAGHDDVSTSMGYVKLAEDLSGTLGVPFAPLPSTLAAASRTACSPLPISPAFWPSEKESGKSSIEFEREKGFETIEIVQLSNNRDELAPTEPARVDLSPRPQVDHWPNSNVGQDPLERALLLAAEAGQFAVVAQLAAELQARRLAASPNVVPMTPANGKRR
jgi:hypothetical protein